MCGPGRMNSSTVAGTLGGSGCKMWFHESRILPRWLFFFCCECDWSGVVIGWRGANQREAVEPEIRMTFDGY